MELESLRCIVSRLERVFKIRSMSPASQFYPTLRLRNVVMLLQKPLKNSFKNSIKKHSSHMQAIPDDGL